MAGSDRGKTTAKGKEQPSTAVQVAIIGAGAAVMTAAIPVVGLLFTPATPTPRIEPTPATLVVLATPVVPATPHLPPPAPVYQGTVLEDGQLVSGIGLVLIGTDCSSVTDGDGFFTFRGCSRVDNLAEPSVVVKGRRECKATFRLRESPQPSMVNLDECKSSTPVATVPRTNAALPPVLAPKLNPGVFTVCSSGTPASTCGSKPTVDNGSLMQGEDAARVCASFQGKPVIYYRADDPYGIFQACDGQGVHIDCRCPPAMCIRGGTATLSSDHRDNYKVGGIVDGVTWFSDDSDELRRGKADSLGPREAPPAPATTHVGAAVTVTLEKLGAPTATVTCAYTVAFVPGVGSMACAPSNADGPKFSVALDVASGACP